MRIGLLIIGSLFWDPSPARCRWRRARFGCGGVSRVRVPIRYGKKARTRNNTYTMVFAASCAGDERLGTGLVVPARAECCGFDHLLEEAETLWAAERDVEAVGGICGEWGKVMIKAGPGVNQDNPVVSGWQAHVRACGASYAPLPTAVDEAQVLDSATGMALLEWPTDVNTQAPLADFDLLLMTATKPTLNGQRGYPSPEHIARAWLDDTAGHVVYFHNNQRYGITTFEDARIGELLRNGPPNQAMEPTAPSGS